ncbi:hypothetical protein D3C71_1887610 [compost metagenome]
MFKIPCVKEAAIIEPDLYLIYDIKMDNKNNNMQFKSKPLIGLLGYLYSIVTGICHIDHIAAVIIADFIKPLLANSRYKKPLQAYSSNKADTPAIVTPIIILAKNS